mmetsp:Transcript_2721/g.3180  ORF Transcript_2721/g.3180 Transcript_2721/m.3180 type:complete len:81 (+) Transcript_2721:98-340(+)
MTSVAMIFRMYIRDKDKREALQQLFLSQEIQERVNNIRKEIKSETNGDIPQWTGEELDRYMNFFKELNEEDIELQILFQK